MTRVAPENRKRSYHPKTRTGCLSCKRVKCGEERPVCLRCTSTGRELECAYEERVATPPENLAQQNVVASRPNTGSRPLMARPLSIPSYYEFGSDQERRSFQFFLANTAPQLAGDFECVFWERLLLQSAHHEPAIRHITVALGSLHEHFDRDVGTPFRSGQMTVHNSFSLRQYISAMRCLMPSSGDSQPIDVCLMACILFVCYEAMRGHYGAAIMHITSGLKILSELRSKSPNTTLSSSSITGRTSYVPIDVLCGLFSRLQAQATVTTYQSGGVLFNIWPELILDPTKPVIFNSLSDAREMLEIYTFYYRQRSLELHSQSLQGEPLDTTIQQSVTVTSFEAIALRDFALALLDNWSAALETFLHEHDATLTDRDRRGASVLQLRKIDSFIALDIIRLSDEATPDDHMEWDKYCSHFEQVVSLGEMIIASPSSPPSFSPSPFSYSSSHPSPFTTTFSLDLGIVGSLFNVAARCRDPGIRRRAVHILRTASVQEGIWNSAVVGAVAERWVEIEEEGLGVVASCTDVPASARLAYFLPVFDVDRRSAVVYFSRVSGVSGVDSESVRTETFQW